MVTDSEIRSEIDWLNCLRWNVLGWREAIDKYVMP